MTESELLKDSAAKPRVFSESDFKFTKPEDAMFQRLSPDRTIKEGESTDSR